MKDLSYYLDLTEELLKGNITEEQKQELQEAAAEDSTIQEAIAEHIEAQANIRIVGAEKLKANLVTAYEEMEETAVKPLTYTKNKETIPKKKKERSIIWTVAALAAAAMMIMALSIPFWWSNSNNSSFTIAEHLDEPPSISVRKIDTTSSPFMTTWLNGETVYQQERYTEALPIFKSIQKNYPKEAKAHEGKLWLYIGLCHLQTKEYSSARDAFQQIQAPNPLAEEAEWHLILTYLAEEETEQAKPLLEKIATNPLHYKKKQANEILQMIK